MSNFVATERSCQNNEALISRPHLSLLLIKLPLAALIAHALRTRDRFIEPMPMTPRLAMLTVSCAFCLTAGMAVAA